MEPLKVGELDGAALDYWVARAEGIEHPCALRKMAPGFVMVPFDSEDEDGPITRYRAFQPSMNPVDGWPIIQREGIQISPPESPVHRHGGPHAGWGESGMWTSTIFRKGPHRRTVQFHETEPLVAAMRAYVASKFGDEVEAIPPRA
jgi:hypothetical protein